MKNEWHEKRKKGITSTSGNQQLCKNMASLMASSWVFSHGIPLASSLLLPHNLPSLPTFSSIPPHVFVELSTSPSSRTAALVPAASPSDGPPQRTSSRFKASTRTSKKPRKKEEDAWEVLFDQLEKDLESGTGVDDSNAISEEEVAELERELDAIIGDVTDSENELNLGHFIEGDSRNEDYVETQEENECDGPEQSDAGDRQRQLETPENLTDEEYEEVRLEMWQLRKLAAALQLGRRRVNVKRLAEEVCLDRAEVLTFLKNPPLDLLTMSAFQESTEQERDGLQSEKNSAEGDTKDEMSNGPVKKEMKPEELTGARLVPDSRNWTGRKRIKKVYLQTFERVYKRTKRPTNTMIENLVHLTNVPSKRIVEWFNNRRLQSKSDSAHSFGQ